MEIQENICKYDLKEKQCSLVQIDALPSDFAKNIEEIIKREGYITHCIKHQEISTDGGNYLGDLYEVDIKGQTHDGKKETNIFVKKIIANDNQKLLSVAEAYYKECFAYNQLAKLFNELQNEASVPIEGRFNMVKSYHVNKKVIMLENMTKQGYKTLNRMDVHALRFAELCLQQLARFHGLSMVLQRKQPDFIDRNLKTMKHAFVFNKQDVEIFFERQCDLCSKKLSPEHKKKIKAFLPIFKKKFWEYLDDTGSPGVMCHADFRTNNVLVKEFDGEFTKVVPVDFQLLFYGCPIYDFFYFIFTGTDRQFRKDHWSNLKNFYYNAMEDFLKYFNMDLNDLFPRKEFERLIKERLDWGLMLALFCSPFLFTVEGQGPDTSKQDLSSLDFVLDHRFDKRVKEVIEDYIEWGIL